ncbi:MAG: GNAT family N-acetyltransferase [Polyangiaceae bacterium]|nr:GNAT family N-acetyltransferase [Polyangiaceae bacterium]
MLRDVSDDDLSIFFEHQREPEANAMAAFPPRDHAAFMTHWRTRVLPDPNNKKKTIVVDGVVVGNVVSWEQDGKRLVGYWLGSAHWGKGVASAALAEFLAAYETTRPVYAFVVETNTPSIRVLEKCGFRRVGDAATGIDHVAERLMRLDA